MPRDPAFQMTVETWWVKLADGARIPSIIARPMTPLIWGMVAWGYELGYQDGIKGSQGILEEHTTPKGSHEYQQ
jgi:hypothetical protein